MGHSSGTPPLGAPGGAITPTQAKKFFEFFSVGTHREVVLLGDLVEQPVHYVRSKGHKVLCGARVGPCQLCELAAHDADTSSQQIEYYAPSYVRTWREREFHQRVAVFSEAAGRQLLAVLDGGPQRGRRVEVQRKSQGTSPRFKIEAKDGMPGGFPAVLPPAFDMVPFIRARYGRAQTPDRPLVFLPPFRCEPAGTSGPSRPRPLALSSEDCQVDEATLTKLRNWMKAKKAEAEQPDPTAVIPAAAEQPAAPEPPPTSPAATAATSPSAAPAADPNPAPRSPAQRSTFRPTSPPPPDADPDPIEGAVDGVVNRFRLSDDPLRVDGDVDQFVYGRSVQRGPKVAVYVPPSGEDQEKALHERTGQTVCGEQKARSPFLQKPGKNGDHRAAKGGAQ